MPTKIGQRWLGQYVLRPQRHRLGLTLFRLYQVVATGIPLESPNMISYYETGRCRIPPENIPALAKAYQLDEREFRLLWYFAEGVDHGIGPETLAILFDRGDVWEPTGPVADGGGDSAWGELPGSDLPGDRRRAERRRPSGGYSAFREAIRTFLREFRRARPGPAGSDESTDAGDDRAELRHALAVFFVLLWAGVCLAV